MPATATLAPASVRTRLIARIRREFDIVEENVALGDRVLPFVRVADPNAVLDDVCAQETRRERGVQPKRELHMPYWAAIWESASALAEHLVARDADAPLAGRRALDLGCGMGLVGTVMAMLGARVTLGDIDTAGLLFARVNTLAWARRARVTRLDWQADDLKTRFDLIAAADVLYDVAQWTPIEAFARRHLATGGVLILAEPSRMAADAYPAWLAERGWTLTTTVRAGGDKTIRIHEARAADTRS
jgi:predicted nicotinamide N-methyase